MKTLNLNLELKDLHHEFHTSLAGSLGASILLLDTQLTAEQSELVDMIIKSNKRLLHFIDHQILNNPIEESELLSHSSAKNQPAAPPKLILKLIAPELPRVKKACLIR